MDQRAEQRWDQAFPVFSGRLTEEEQRFRDYFQTELEDSPLDEEVEQALDRREILSGPEYAFRNIDLQEYDLAEDTNIGYLEKVLFNFKYRQARNPDHPRREAHLIAQQRQRFEAPEVRELLRRVAEDPASCRAEYLRFVSEEGLRMVKDYYAQENLGYLDEVPASLKSSFAEAYEDLTQLPKDTSSYVRHAMPAWDSRKGLLANLGVLGRAAASTPLATTRLPRRTITEQELQKIQEGNFDLK